MKKSSFYKCLIFSYYYGIGLFWFKILTIGLSFKHIANYKFTKIEPKPNKGIFFGYWYIELIT